MRALKQDSVILVHSGVVWGACICHTTVRVGSFLPKSWVVQIVIIASLKPIHVPRLIHDRRQLCHNYCILNKVIAMLSRKLDLVKRGQATMDFLHISTYSRNVFVLHKLRLICIIIQKLLPQITQSLLTNCSSSMKWNIW